MSGLIIARYLRRERSLKHHPPQRQDSDQRRSRMAITKSDVENGAPDHLLYNGVDGCNQCFLRLGAVPAEMGDELDRLGAGALGAAAVRAIRGSPDEIYCAIKAQRGGGGVPCTK